MNQKYNGWTNYETWNYALWIDNDQGSQEYWQEKAQEAFGDSAADGHYTRKEYAAFTLEEWIKDDANLFVSETMPGKMQSSWLADAVNSYLSEVNFFEIAEHFLADVEDAEETSK